MQILPPSLQPRIHKQEDFASTWHQTSLGSCSGRAGTHGAQAGHTLRQAEASGILEFSLKFYDSQQWRCIIVESLRFLSRGFLDLQRHCIGCADESAFAQKNQVVSINIFFKQLLRGRVRGEMWVYSITGLFTS